MQLEPTFWGFPYKTPIHYVCRKLPKHYVKFSNFSSIACINVGSFSMSFGCEIFSGFGDSSCWNFNFRFSLLKLTFLYFQSWRLATQEPLIILEPKLMEKLPTLTLFHMGGHKVPPLWFFSCGFLVDASNRLIFPDFVPFNIWQVLTNLFSRIFFQNFAKSRIEDILFT